MYDMSIAINKGFSSYNEKAHLSNDKSKLYNGSYYVNLQNLSK